MILNKDKIKLLSEGKVIFDSEWVGEVISLEKFINILRAAFDYDRIYLNYKYWVRVFEDNYDMFDNLENLFTQYPEYKNLPVLTWEDFYCIKPSETISIFNLIKHE